MSYNYFRVPDESELPPMEVPPPLPEVSVACEISAEFSPFQCDLTGHFC